MIKNGIPMVGAKILVLGFTFKEDCPDLRNTRVVDLVREFCEFGAAVDIYDPWASLDEAEREYGLQLLNEMPDAGTYDAVVIAVGHKEFRELPKGFLRALGNPKGSILYDVKCVLPAGEADGRL
jgi:UDP-N-acetyl-D-galactosamine dehydrogenase